MHLNKLIIIIIIIALIIIIIIILIIIIIITFRSFLADFSIFEGGKKTAKVFPLLFVHF
jgi:hypothetical protein